MERIQLSDHFTYRKLFAFTIGPICTMIFTSLYTIVDGFFVSNYVGSTAFAALNLTMPFIMMIAAVGFMFGSGGSALVSMYLGTGNRKKANSSFSIIVYSMIAIGVVLATLGALFATQISEILGAGKSMLPYCVIYIRINMIGIVFYMLQNLFQTFFITAEHPRMGFVVTLIAGGTNMILDWLLVGILNLGIAGAAWATITSQMLGGGIPLLFFTLSKKSPLKLGRAKLDMKVISKACGNGVSEFLSNVSASIVGFLYNLQLLHYAGKNGVAAYGVIMYVGFVFVAIYIGYSIGTAPVVGFNYGAGNKKELQNIFSKSVIILGTANVLMCLSAEILSNPLVRLFVGYDKELYELTANGMKIYSIAFLMMGYNIYASAFFTALNNGVVSAVLSVSRTLVLQIIMIYLLPALFGINGLWTVVIAVEGIGLLIAIYFIMKNRERYGYMKTKNNKYG